MAEPLRTSDQPATAVEPTLVDEPTVTVEDYASWRDRIDPQTVTFFRWADWVFYAVCFLGFVAIALEISNLLNS